MANLIKPISGLTDREAIRAANYVAEWMQKELRQAQKLPTELQGEITDDQAVDLLTEAFADISGSVQHARLTADESQRGQVARNLLLLLAEDERYVAVVQNALDYLAFKAEPITMMAMTAGIVFLLCLEFEVQYEVVKGKRKLRWRVGKKAAPTELVKKVLSLGTKPDN